MRETNDSLSGLINDLLGIELNITGAKLAARASTLKRRVLDDQDVFGPFLKKAGTGRATRYEIVDVPNFKEKLKKVLEEENEDPEAGKYSFRELVGEAVVQVAGELTKPELNSLITMYMSMYKTDSQVAECMTKGRVDFRYTVHHPKQLKERLVELINQHRHGDIHPQLEKTKAEVYTINEIRKTAGLTFERMAAYMAEPKYAKLLGDVSKNKAGEIGYPKRNADDFIKAVQRNDA